MTKIFDVNNAIITALALPEGVLINGQIVPSVTSSNLTVAIKGLDGNDPSATNPVYVRINNTIRSITSALSVTKNAATNWCNLGGATLATKEVDLFAYLIWNTTPATDIVDVGFSRIPFGRVYSDFSGTSTNEKYLAQGNASAPTATDDCVVIGRFAATLSAGAGYTWSVPTYTSVNLIQRPIFETRSLIFAPQGSAAGTGTPTYTVTSVGCANYIVSGNKVHVELVATGTTGGSTVYELRSSMPFEVKNAGQSLPATAIVLDTGVGVNQPGFALFVAGTPDVVGARKPDSSNFAIGAGQIMRVNTDYIVE